MLNFKSMGFSFKKLLVCALAVFVSSAVSAQSLPDTCDGDFYEVMRAQSWMEAKREMEIAQTLILKPDSVLEYSCFNNQLKALGDVSKDMFGNATGSTKLFQQPPQTYTPGDDASGDFPQFLPAVDEDSVTAPHTGQNTVQFGPQPPGGIGNARLGNVMGILTVDSEFSYNVDNFGHPYLGGFFPGSPSSTVCDPMQIVWDFAKCQNFQSVRFLTFSELASADPRVVPLYNTLNCNVAGRSAKWNAAIAATNFPPGVAVGAEAVVTNISMMDSKDCKATPAVLTGLQIERNTPLGSVSYDDAVCLAAGCYFDYAAGTCN